MGTSRVTIQNTSVQAVFGAGELNEGQALRGPGSLLSRGSS